MQKLFLSLALIAILAACGGAPSDQSEASSQATSASADSAEDKSFVIAVSGAETFDFEPNPTLGCVDDQMQVITMTQAPRFDLYLPALLTPGEYALAQHDPNADQKYVDGSAVVTFNGQVDGNTGRFGRFYFIPESGALNVTATPAEGERFVADLDATLAEKDGETVRLQAQFDLELSSMMTMNCAATSNN